MYLVFENINLIHSKNEKELEFLRNYTLVIDKSNGKIIELVKNGTELKTKLNEETTEFKRFSSSHFIIPGFVDTHTHAPQYGFSGTGLDLPLLEWLEKYTFPFERMFENLECAKNIYSKCVKRHLRNGSTTVCFYGTIHLEATKLLSDIIESNGLRGNFSFNF
jgi:guanine deaminase